MTALRWIALLAALAGGQAQAQTWRDIVSREQGVAVQFPDTPMITPGVYPADGGAPATIYSLQRGGSTFRLTVADFSGHGGDQGKAVRQAVATAHAGGGVKLDVEECISGYPGRELSILGAEGGQSKVSVFAVGPRLYVLEVTIGAADLAENSSDGVRFQQSLRFSGPRLGPQNLGGVCRGRARASSEVSP